MRWCDDKIRDNDPKGEDGGMEIRVRGPGKRDEGYNWRWREEEESNLSRECDV